jgi:hypothetical protein
MKGQQLQEAARGVMEGAPPRAAPPDPAVSAAAERLAALLADVAQLDEVPLDRTFVDDLGADSLVMAHFCARVRNRPDLPPVSMRDVYRHPTAGSLAVALLDSTPPPPESETPGPPALPGEQAEAPAPAPPTGRPHRVLCGVLQLLAFLCYAFLLAAVTAQGYEWISAPAHLLDAYLRSVVFGAGLLLVLCALPVIAKWLLFGRFTPRRFRVWSFTYFRFWLVKTLIRSSPLVLFARSPLYPLFLRALGARIGAGVTILSRSAPVCTDLLTVGDGTLVRKDALISCYHAAGGVIETGPVAW